ncbi:hypothetical protein [Streptomyces griseoloalbus]|uniref:Uncharacterized protein n=1 Tax=Streptomyces griseoloalbus TaxID=67303 RepID=A0A7W8FBZ7_9ACTN|nr:hypothetical protein [Streptomyces albaduncus]MBB5128854.1 hypothetical protein [Streptomyces albaduncus]GGW43370.1 hypothetical protein GCM10010340_21840 [Streptomyces albaduncus]
MTQLSGWKVLNPGRGGGGLVLAVDFATTGRSDSAFSDLAPRLDPALALWETRQPAGTARPTAEDYLALWDGEAAADGRTVRAVLGYCAGSVFAGELAARIAARQGEAPHLVLFEPEVPAPAGLYRDFAAMMNQFASVLTADEVSAAQQEADAARRDAVDFGDYGGILERIFMERAGAAFTREELDTELLDEFVAVFRSYVSYLDAARRVDPAAAWRTGTAVSSRTPSAGAALAGRTVDVDVDHADMLRDGRVAEVVNGIIGTYAAP